MRIANNLSECTVCSLTIVLCAAAEFAEFVKSQHLKDKHNIY